MRRKSGRIVAGTVIQILQEKTATNNIGQHTHNQKQKVNAEAPEVNAEVAETGWDLRMGTLVNW